MEFEYLFIGARTDFRGTPCIVTDITNTIKEKSFKLTPEHVGEDRIGEHESVVLPCYAVHDQVWHSFALSRIEFDDIANISHLAQDICRKHKWSKQLFFQGPVTCHGIRRAFESDDIPKFNLTPDDLKFMETCHGFIMRPKSHPSITWYHPQFMQTYNDMVDMFQNSVPS